MIRLEGVMDKGRCDFPEGGMDSDFLSLLD